MVTSVSAPAGAATDEEVVRCLAEGLRRRGERAAVSALDRSPYPYATSFSLEEVVARLDDGRTLHLILKDLGWGGLLGDARRTKPPFLYDPRRCQRTYEAVLPGTGVGVECWGTLADGSSGRHLLLLERVPGVELWQIGEVDVWAAVARWLARFHLLFAAEGEEVSRRNPHLLRYGARLLRVWPGRALEVAGARGTAPEQLRRLGELARNYDAVVARLTSGHRQLVHGELYPSNVLVAGAGEAVEVWPVDWEMAGVGSPLLDLAALTGGWQGEVQDGLVDAYLDELGSGGAWWPIGRDEIDALLDCCRLHYALQWLGWSPQWCPPREHARDWVSEALALGERLGLV